MFRLLMTIAITALLASSLHALTTNGGIARVIVDYAAPRASVSVVIVLTGQKRRKHLSSPRFAESSFTGDILTTALFGINDSLRKKTNWRCWLSKESST